MRHQLKLVTLAVLVASIIIPGCGAPARPVLTEAQLYERAAVDAADSDATMRNAVTKLMGRLERDTESGATLNLLALSGGGDYGAFGAGFLVGWGAAPDDEWRRPNFDAVTGVSTGALLAPFAFLGTEEAYLTVEQFYRNPKRDWVRERGLLFFLPFRPSFMEIPGLERDIRGAINENLIEKLAAESREGKVLVISATDLDLGRQKYWDLGLEAEHATTKEGVDRVQRVLLASAAIPAVFTPIQIGDAIYADGGVTANVFLRLDPRNPNGLIMRWRAAHPDIPLPKVRYWLIINNQLSQPPKTVQVRWPAVVGPSLATAIRSATVAEIRWLAAQADYVNLLYGTDIEVRVVSIPDDWRPPVEGTFKKETMESLADLGRKLGANPSSWKVWAAPRTQSGTNSSVVPAPGTAIRR